MAMKSSTLKPKMYSVLPRSGSMTMLSVALSMCVCIASAQTWKIIDDTELSGS